MTSLILYAVWAQMDFWWISSEFWVDFCQHFKSQLGGSFVNYATQKKIISRPLLPSTPRISLEKNSCVTNSSPLKHGVICERTLAYLEVLKLKQEFCAHFYGIWCLFIKVSWIVAQLSLLFATPLLISGLKLFVCNKQKWIGNAIYLIRNPWFETQRVPISHFFKPNLIETQLIDSFQDCMLLDPAKNCSSSLMWCILTITLV